MHKTQSKKLNLVKAFGRVWKYHEPFKKVIAYFVSLRVSVLLLFSFIPYASGKIIDALGNKDTKGFMFFMGLLFGIMVLRWFINMLSEKVDLAKINFNLDRHLHRISTEKYLGFSLGQHMSKHSSIKTSVINRGVNAVMTVGSVFIDELFPVLFNMVVPVILVFFVSKFLALIMLLFIVLIMIYVAWYNKKFFGKIAENRKLFEEASRIRGDFRSNVETVITFSQESKALSESEGKYSKASEFGKNLWNSYINFFSIGSFNQMFSLIILQSIAGYMVFNGQLTVGLFVTLLAWFNQGLGQVQSLAGIQRRFLVSYVDLIKFDNLMKTVPDISDKKDAHDLTGNVDCIEFNQVKFAYPKRVVKDENSLNILTSIYEADSNHEALSMGADVLKGLSLKFRKGNKYAIVGHSGAGKTTVIQMILRAYDPQSGSVVIDGKDIRDIKVKSLRDAIGVVPQEIAIFDGTLRDNILFGLDLDRIKNISDSDLMKVIEHSRISEFFSGLENGLDTMLGEKGLKLSGGQRQRVGIARAIIKDPEVLIFDEATSHLDMKNEEMIRNSIIEVSEGKTLITIAHRLATVRDMDEIIVMKEGVIVGQGTHSELAESNPVYQELIKSQVF